MEKSVQTTVCRLLLYYCTFAEHDFGTPRHLCNSQLLRENIKRINDFQVGVYGEDFNDYSHVCTVVNTYVWVTQIRKKMCPRARLLVLLCKTPHVARNRAGVNKHRNGQIIFRTFAKFILPKGIAVHFPGRSLMFRFQSEILNL